MDAKARYRAANLAMWASWALFFALVIYSALYAPFRLSRTPLFTFGFLAMLVAFALSFGFGVRAYKTVHCGKCRHRFFDRLFVFFPIKHGCSKCDASIDDAFIVPKEA